MKSERGQISGTEVLDLPIGWDAIAECAPMPIAVTAGERYAIRYANPAFCRLLGKSEAELTGSPFCKTVPIGDSCMRLLERVYRTGKAETYTENESETPHSVYGFYAMWPIFGDEALSGASDLNCPVGVVVQVTERESLHRRTVAINEGLILSAVRQHEISEVTAKKLENRFQFLAESMPQKMFTATPDGEIDYFNQQWLAYTGLSSEAILNSSWARFIHPDDIEETLRSWRYAVQSEEPFLLESRFRSAEGTYRWHLSRALPMRDEHGKIVMWVGTNTDIDDSKKSQEALMRVEKLAAAGRLSASIAHEINNPLESVTNMLYLARTAAGIPDDVRNYLEIADGELMRIAHITRQTLGFYREPNAPSTFAASTLLASVVEVVQAKIMAKQAQVEVRCDAALRMTAVFGEMRQVFANLLLNSLDAIADGGKVKLRASRCAPSCSIRITVADNGNGIHKDALAHIFEPFFTTKGTIGTGLGLWVSKQIVEKHRGKVHLRSSTEGPRRGTVFSIILPAAD